jgi:ribonuclease J
MLVKHARLAEQVGVPVANIFITDIGNVIEFTDSGARRIDNVPSGRVLIDGLGIGDIGNIVLRDRKQLSQDGILIAVVTINRLTGAVIAGPDIVTRGFVYVRDSEEIINEAKKVIKEAMLRCQQEGIHQWAILKNRIKDAVGKNLYQKTGRRPMIIPIIQELRSKELE